MFRQKPRYVALPQAARATVGEEVDRLSCPKCEIALEPARLEAAHRVCYRCGYHFRLRAGERIEMLLDPDTFQEEGQDVVATDVLGFNDSQPYVTRIERSRAETGLNEAAVWGEGVMGGHRVVTVVLDFAFMGGSMGAATGEKITTAIERANDRRLPLIIVSASGGARMQEGVLSLMQMAKTSAALGRLAAVRVPFFSLLTDPTMGGVTASFASVADVILAEPGAMIGFAGSRVIQQATYETLPEGFQTAEFLLKHGMIDLVVPRAELPATFRQLLDLYDHQAVQPVQPAQPVEAPTPAARPAIVP